MGGFVVSARFYGRVLFLVRNGSSDFPEEIICGEWAN